MEFQGIDPEVRIVYSGQVFPIDETVESITKGFKCLAINNEALRTQFIGPDDRGSYSVSICNI